MIRFTFRGLREGRNDETGTQNRSTIRSMPGWATQSISEPPKHGSLTLTLCQDNYAVPSRIPRASSPTISILAEATFQEETRVAVRKSLPRMTRKGRSGSRLSAHGLRYGLKTAVREIRTPPGILVPEITAPDGGTTRGRPARVGTAMRSVSLMTAVYSIRSQTRIESNNRMHLPRREAFRILRSSVVGQGQATLRVSPLPTSASPRDCAVNDRYQS